MPALPFALPSLDAVVALVRHDAAAGRFALWGASTAIDENTGTAVIDESLFDTLHEAAGIPATFPVGNAGVLHVYSYWFSPTLTPYGYKRDRWADGILATALGRADDAFHLHRPGEDTTPLERVMDAALPLLTHPDAASAGSATAGVGDLVTRVALHRVGDTGPVALVYGVGTADSDLRLVTVFPLHGDPDPLLAEFAREPRLRWNATDPRS